MYFVTNNVRFYETRVFVRLVSHFYFWIFSLRKCIQIVLFEGGELNS